MGQVWSKADFDGVLGQGNEGGRGSCLAVTSQNPGNDGTWGTADDVLETLNTVPLNISSDQSLDESDQTNALDRVRGFYSYHPQGAVFVFGDGSTRYIAETIDTATYRHLSTIRGGEVIQDF